MVRVSLSEKTVKLRECELCKGGIQANMTSIAESSRALAETIRAESKAQIEAIRREIMLSFTISTTLTGIFIGVLGFILTR